jgi:hypothetical protein
MLRIPRSEWLNQAQWAITAPLLLAGALGAVWTVALALGLCAVSTIGYGWVLGSIRPYRIQVRLGFMAFVLASQVPGLGGLLWVPVLGTTAQVLLGYCPMARMLDLMPWNRVGAPGWRDVLDTVVRAPGDEGLLSFLWTRRPVAGGLKVQAERDGPVNVGI